MPPPEIHLLGPVGVAAGPPEAPAEEEVTLGVQEAIQPTTGVD